MFEKDYDKYFVLKQEDIDKYLSKDRKTDLERIRNEIELRRIEDSKKLNTYIVVNEDEYYSSLVWELIKVEEEEPGKNNNLYNGLSNAIRTFK